MRSRARSAISTTTRSPPSARPRRRKGRRRNEGRCQSHGCASPARRLRRRRAQRSQGRAAPADQGSARARRPPAAGEALRAGPVYRRGPGRSVSPRAHRGRGGRARGERVDRADRRTEEAPARAARGVPARVDPDARHHHPAQGDLRAGEGRPQPVSGEEGQLHGAELRRNHRDRRGADQSEGAGAGLDRRLGRAHERAATGGGKTMNTKKATTITRAFLLWLAGLGIAMAQGNSIDNLEVSQQAGKTVVRITTKEPLKSVPPNFSVATPARIAFDFPNTVNALGRSSQDIGQGELRSMNLVQGADRTRLVLNLRRPVGHEATIEGNTLVITLAEAPVAQTPPASVAHFAEGKADVKHAVRDIDFRRGRAGEGRVIVDLSDTTTGIDIRVQGQNIVVDFLKTSLPEALRRRLDVIDFGTPVNTVSTFPQGENVRMVIEPKGQWEHNAYQSDTQFVLEVKPVVADPARAAAQRGRYTGERLSLNFQNVEVRAVLNVIADFTDLNIITSDTVTGNITLRLKDVPWDQALEIILQTRGLDSRRSGNVIWIAPRDELATREKLALEAANQISDLEQTRTESFQMNYQKATDVQKLLSDPTQRILSKRGSAVVDARTNTLFVQDTPTRLEEVRRLIAKIDVAARQVMIEARIVEATDTFARNLGSRIALNDRKSDGHRILGQNSPRFVAGGGLASEGFMTGQIADVPNFFGDTTNVNLPAVGLNNFGAGQFSLILFDSGATRFLNLEISALEADGKGKIIASPRVLTADQVEAQIEQGTEIPYQTATSSGATALSFRKAVLSLKVKPQITPEGNVIMTLDVNKDQPGQLVPGGVQINTKHVKTEVLVENGGTVVIGGIYEQNDRTDITQVPFFGDLPVIGWLFKNKATTSAKTELLVFITPRIINERLTIR